MNLERRHAPCRCRSSEILSPHSLRFTPARPCEGSVSHFTPDDLFAATHAQRHTAYLAGNPSITVYINAAEEETIGPGILASVRL